MALAVTVLVPGAGHEATGQTHPVLFGRTAIMAWHYCKALRKLRKRRLDGSGIIRIQDMRTALRWQYGASKVDFDWCEIHDTAQTPCPLDLNPPLE